MTLFLVAQVSANSERVSCDLRFNILFVVSFICSRNKYNHMHSHNYTYISMINDVFCFFVEISQSGSLFVQEHVFSFDSDTPSFLLFVGARCQSYEHLALSKTPSAKCFALCIKWTETEGLFKLFVLPSIIKHQKVTGWIRAQCRT